MNNFITPLNAIDFYKADHRSQYPEGTELVFSNWTPRSSRIPEIDEVVFFGLQYYMQEYLETRWDQDFFSRPKSNIVDAYARRMRTSGITIEVDHVEALHDLGFLPIEIWALPEGTSVPLGVPMFVIWNMEEHPQFSWLVNYLETSLSHTLWGPCTSATIAKDYRRISTKYAEMSGGAPEFIDWQNHDFSCRGMYGFEASMMSGAAHLLSFTGTDTVSAIDFLEQYYDADADDEMIGGSVPATEHSVMSMGGQDSELDTYRRLLNLYSTGIVSVVSDTWDYWKVWTEVLPALKTEIMGRDGTLVIRPDSGDPYKILVGDVDSEPGSPEHKGSYTLAWELFGGTTNDKGLKVLDSHIGLIYGEKITRALAERIYQGLILKGFVPTCVLGIGSFTYQYNTRDTFGFAMKATYGVVNGEGRPIFKDPKTDDGWSKKSARGLLAVHHNYNTGKLVQHQQVSWDAVKNCEFNQVFCKRIVRREKLSDIRKRVQSNAR